MVANNHVTGSRYGHWPGRPLGLGVDLGRSRPIPTGTDLRAAGTGWPPHDCQFACIKIRSTGYTAHTGHIRPRAGSGDSGGAAGKVQKLALRVGVGRAIEGRTEAARTAHGFAEPGNYPGTMLNGVRVQ